jgi:drug/metabolite transporter (DMT)-like permease
MTPRTQVLLAALLFSTAGIAIKASTLTHWQIACLRSAVGALVLLAAFRHVRRPTLPVLTVSALIAVTFVSFVAANKMTTAAHAVFLQAAAPVYLVLVSPWLLGERASLRDLPFMLTVFVGVTLLAASTGDASATATQPVLGNIIAIASGVTWALALVGLRWLEQRDTGARSAVTATVYANLLVAALCLPLAWPLHEIGTVDWMVVLYLGAFQLGGAYVLLVRGLRHLTAIETSLLLLLESALNPVWTWLGHGESPGWLGILGGALVLGATTLRSIRRASA